MNEKLYIVVVLRTNLINKAVLWNICVEETSLHRLSLNNFTHAWVRIWFSGALTPPDVAELYNSIPPVWISYPVLLKLAGDVLNP